MSYTVKAEGMKDGKKWVREWNFVGDNLVDDPDAVAGFKEIFERTDGVCDRVTGAKILDEDRLLLGSVRVLWTKPA